MTIADFFTDSQFAAFPIAIFADAHGAINGQPAQGPFHGFHGGLIGGFLVPPAHPDTGGARGGFGYAHGFHGKIATGVN